MPRSSSVVVRQGMPTRGLETVFSWGLAGVMEDQIVTFGVKGGNLWKRDPWTVATPAARPRLQRDWTRLRFLLLLDGCGWRRGTPHPRVFLWKSAESPENKRVAFCMSAQAGARV